MENTTIYPLSPFCEEMVFAPFHDPVISSSLDFKLNKLSALQCEVKRIWCYTNLIWESAEPGSVAIEFNLKSNVKISEYNQLILCLSVPANVTFFTVICIDDKWIKNNIKYTGEGERTELQIPITGISLTGIKLNFISNEIGHHVVHLSWFGLQNKILIDRLTASQKLFDWNWNALIKNPDEWPEIQFEKGLLFNPNQLTELRIKKNSPLWKEHYLYLEEQANLYLSRIPEHDLGEYLPVNDGRYIREREKNRSPYHSEALVLGFVGLINNNKEMMYHSLRYLCCMLHTRFWVQSAESKLCGSTWDQRCFMEEMTTTSVVLLADWFSFALTDQSKQLIQQSIWDKGLATIERDMMKHEYLYRCNQGIGFCRARILGGLYLQDTWPRVGNYVEKAYTDLNEIMDGYLNKDGGIDEGIGYFCQSFQAALPAFIAYANNQGLDFRKILKKKFKKTIKYIASMSSTAQGKAIPTGDCRTEYFCGDVIPIMAAIFPQSVFGGQLKPCLEKGSIFAVTGMMANSGGILGFIYGPEEISEINFEIPDFIRLPDTGILSSNRYTSKNSVRIHLQGSRENPSHSHFDKGSFVVEVDQHPVLIDPGMSSYASINAASLPQSSLHNVLTPVFENNVYPDQDIPSKPVIPKGHGTNTNLNAKIDLSNVWRSHMCSYTRYIKSNQIDEFSITDSGILKLPGYLAFHLQSVMPFEIKENSVFLKTKKFTLCITADWATTIHQEQKIIDLVERDVYTLIMMSDVLARFNLITQFKINYYD